MEVILIRHYPTPGNRKRQYIGRTDEAIDESGITNLPVFQAERVIASPMRRCIQTAALLFPDQEISEAEELRECDFGLFEGKTYEQLKEEPVYVEWLESGGMIPFPEGEDPAAFRRRCADGVRDAIRSLMKEGVQSVAFVVHGGTIMSALEALSEEDRGFYHWQVKNGEGYLAFADEREWEAGEEKLRRIRKTER